jgi:hypothetical protein
MPTTQEFAVPVDLGLPFRVIVNLELIPIDDIRPSVDCSSPLLGLLLLCSSSIVIVIIVIVILTHTGATPTCTSPASATPSTAPARTTAWTTSAPRNDRGICFDLCRGGGFDLNLGRQGAGGGGGRSVERAGRGARALCVSVVDGHVHVHPNIIIFNRFSIIDIKFGVVLLGGLAPFSFSFNFRCRRGDG